MKQKYFSAGITLFLTGFLLLYPKEALAASKEGLRLWLETLLPTLLPFLILTSVLIHTDSISKIVHPIAPFFKTVFGLSEAGTYAFLLGLLCGYPMGAKLSADLYYAGKLDRKESEYLLTFCNNPSPAFLITYLCQICLNGKIPAAMVIFILMTANSICMLLFRFFFFQKKEPSKQRYTHFKSTAAPDADQWSWDAAIMSGFETIAKLGGYIFLFSIGSACFCHFWSGSSVWKYVLLGFFELTTGLYNLQYADLPFSAHFVTAISMCAFGGLCIFAQTKSVLGRELSLRPYALAKCINAAVTAALCLILIA